MNPKEQMSVEQVKEFFSQTHEFSVTEEGHNIRIFYTDDLEDRTTSVLLYKGVVNIQQLIRKIKQLVWNHCNNILD